MKNMDEKNWRKRFKYRVDLSSRVTHLTKGETAEEAFRNLINILLKKYLKNLNMHIYNIITYVIL